MKPMVKAPNSQLIQLHRAWVLLLLLLASSVAAWKLTPTTSMATMHGKFDLEKAIPTQFGDWRVDTARVEAIVSPERDAMLKRLYSQTLSRTYINSKGERIMMSLAYGIDQRDGTQMHYPEVCYPAQGFKINSNKPVNLKLGNLNIPARLLETSLGNQRYEPVTYWTVIGETVVRGGIEKKLVEIDYGLKNLIPDGILIRLSNIDRNNEAAFALQRNFAAMLMQEVDPKTRKRLAGEQ